MGIDRILTNDQVSKIGGIPAGGSAGQRLTKIDGTDYNTQWETPAGGGGGDVFPLKTNTVYVDETATPVAGFLYNTVSAAYAYQKTQTPSATKRLTIIVGFASAADTVAMDTSYIDIVGFYQTGMLYDHNGYDVVNGKHGGKLRPSYVDGTITVSVDNVKLIGINCDRLTVTHASDNSEFSHLVVTTAIQGTTAAYIGGSWHDVHAGTFFSDGGTYPTAIPTGQATGNRGYWRYCTGGGVSNNDFGRDSRGLYENCHMKVFGFGFQFNASGEYYRCSVDGGFATFANASGRFTHCEARQETAGKYSFGSGHPSTNNRAQGYFENCHARGGVAAATFGSTYATVTSGSAQADGTFVSCTVPSVGFAAYGLASGFFYNCLGDASFGYNGGGIASGYFHNCYGAGSFGTAGVASGKFVNCGRLTASGNYSFGGLGTASGEFMECVTLGSGLGSFGGNASPTPTVGGATGTFSNCKSEHSYSFGSNSTLGSPGTFNRCKGTITSFGYDFAPHLGIVSGVYNDLEIIGGIFCVNNSMTGIMRNTRLKESGVNNNPVITLGSNAVLEYCTFIAGDATNNVSVGLRRQDDQFDITVVNNTLYSFTYAGETYSYNSDSDATLGEIQAGLIASVATGTLASSNAQGAGIQVIALLGGVGYAVTAVSADLVHTTEVEAEPATSGIQITHCKIKTLGGGAIASAITNEIATPYNVIDALVK